MWAWMDILLPLILVVSRVTAFVVVLPIFGWTSLPKTVRVGLAMMLSLVLAGVVPIKGDLQNVHWLAATMLVGREVLTGLALGLAIRLLFEAVQQGATMATQQMGFSDAGIINPGTGSSGQPVAMLMEMLFTLLFLGAGGAGLLVLVVAGSFEAFPVGGAPDPSGLVVWLIDSGSRMLTFALRLAAPVLGAFLLLSIVLGILARVLPEMNILMTSLPLRVGLGLVMARQIMPFLDNFARELANWVEYYLVA